MCYLLRALVFSAVKWACWRRWPLRFFFKNTVVWGLIFLLLCLLSYSSVCFSLEGSDDLSAKLWDVSTGQCVYGIQTHTCAAVKFDEQKLVTGSFDNTVACWEWSSGARTQHFRGHTGAGGLPFFKGFCRSWTSFLKARSVIPFSFVFEVHLLFSPLLSQSWQLIPLFKLFL